MKKRFLFPGLLVAILVATYFSGPKIPVPVYQSALPQVPGAVDELDRYITQLEDDPRIRRDNHARIQWYGCKVEKTEYAIVYLHGFGGSWKDGWPANQQLADSLAANIYYARWGNHGLKPPHSMVGFTADSAWNDALQALAIGKQLGEKVIILSTSTGGTLGLRDATFKDDVYALINFSPNARDDMPGTWALNTPWGSEIASLIGFGDGMRNPAFEPPAAHQYFDTAYVASALVDLQNLVSTTMIRETFTNVYCPTLTLYYYANEFEEDERVEVEVYDEMHAALGSPDGKKKLKALPTPGTHFLGSDILSSDWETPLNEAISFIRSL